MSDLSPISPRLHAIQSRVAQIEQAATTGSGNARLGFGLALQNAAIDAQQTSGTATAPAATPTAPAAPTASIMSSPSITLDTPTPEPDPADARPALTPATPRSGGYPRLRPPDELVGYGNGRIPSSALAAVGDTGHRLYAPAATALNTLMADAAEDGVTVGITDSYRSYSAQENLADRKGLYNQGGLAARPGTSNHGWGMATDLRLDDAALAWMRENAARYGFVEDVPREPWHWTYRPD
ncbi:MAG: M15 family metallopeptidase [Acidimicrobiales bacterium]